VHASPYTHSVETLTAQISLQNVKKGIFIFFITFYQQAWM